MMRALRLGWIAVFGLCAMMTSCMSSTVRVQSRDAFAAQFSAIANEQAARLVGDAPEPALCLPSYDGAGCVLIRGGREQPPCAMNGCESSFIAIEVRAALMERPDVRRLLEQEAARYCSYVAGPAGTEHTPTRAVVGCRTPGPPFRLFREERPALCIFVIGSGDGLQIVERYAVRDGARAANAWCDEIAP